jgi:hypothetical protein
MACPRSRASRSTMGIPIAGGALILIYHSPARAHILPLLAGMPSPEYFPFTSISNDILPTDDSPLTTTPPPRTTRDSSPLGWPWRSLFGSGNGDGTTRVRIPRKSRQGDGGLNLATVLEHGPTMVLTRIQAFVREFTERVYAPAYADWTTLVTHFLLRRRRPLAFPPLPPLLCWLMPAL